MSPRNCPAGVVTGRFGPDFPGTHCLGDLLQLSFASSQRDLFEDGWLEFVVRVYWLKGEEEEEEEAALKASQPQSGTLPPTRPYLLQQGHSLGQAYSSHLSVSAQSIYILYTMINCVVL